MIVKENLDTNTIDEHVVAYANSKGGTVILGFWDDEKVLRQHLVNYRRARVNCRMRKCTPSISVKVVRDSGLVGLEVPEGADKPYHCETGYFWRLDGSTVMISRDALRTMFAQSDPRPIKTVPAKCVVCHNSSDKVGTLGHRRRVSGR